MLPKGWRHRPADVIVFTLLLLLTSLTLLEVHERSHGYGVRQRPWRSITAMAWGHWGHSDEQEQFDSGLESWPDPPLEEDAGPAPRCQVEKHTEYSGEVVLWGVDHLQPSADSCCEACAQHAKCDVWVWCGMLSGCGPERVPLPAGSLGTMGTRKYRECWLKTSSLEAVMNEQGFPHPDVGWVSGSVFPERPVVEAQEKSRLAALRNNRNLPLVFLDISIRGRYVGRIEIVLFKNTAPLAAENFRMLCTGEKGIVPPGRQGAGTTYAFKGRAFYRIIDRFIDQTGANTESIYGGTFKDDPGGLALKHDRKGLLSMVNAGPDSNTSHFSILMGPAEHLDGKYVIFGEVVAGMEVALKINSLARGRPGNTAGLDAEAVIIDSGEIVR